MALRIFAAFPSFGPKIPQKTLIDIPAALMLGGWLGGALHWHFTFMWIFAGGGLLYVISQVASGHYRVVLFTPRDVPGVWPMARQYFLFGPKPAATGPYNPLQKLASPVKLAARLLANENVPGYNGDLQTLHDVKLVQPAATKIAFTKTPSPGAFRSQAAARWFLSRDRDVA